MDDTEFIRALRSALNNFYEPDQLRGNPLVAELGLEGRIDAPAALQEILTGAIDAIRDQGDQAISARAWLAYEVLHLRYVRGYGREEVAQKLNVSDRQFSRELKSAIETLAVHVWREHSSASAIGRIGATSFRGEEQESEPDDQPETEDSAAERAESDGATWLQGLPEESPSSWREVLESVLALLQPVMTQQQARLQIQVESRMPEMLVAQNTLRQSLLVLLGWLFSAASGETITLKPGIIEGQLRLRWEVVALKTLLAQLLADAERAIAVPSQLLAHRGGSLQAMAAQDDGAHGHLVIDLTIPALAQVPVLAIDDNLDTLHLFQRYVQGTRYALVGVSSPDELARVLERVQPRIILLDVMMPEIDGWDMLARLRQLPDAESRAIIVCSIMPLASVAHSLGADGFLQKPLLPQLLLQTLDAHMELLSS